jgi:hypothetical protein
MKKLLKIIGYFFNNVIGFKQIIDILDQVFTTLKELIDAIKSLKKTENE